MPLLYLDWITVTHCILGSASQLYPAWKCGENVAARLLTSTKKRDHIAPVLHWFYTGFTHWLPVHCWVNLKILLLVFKSLNDLAPPYLSDLLTYLHPVLSLQSSNPRLLCILMLKLKCRAGRAFLVAAHTLWNVLPFCIWYAHSVSVFKSKNLSLWFGI